MVRSTTALSYAILSALYVSCFVTLLTSRTTIPLLLKLTIDQSSLLFSYQLLTSQWSQPPYQAFPMPLLPPLAIHGLVLHIF